MTDNMRTAETLAVEIIEPTTVYEGAKRDLESSFRILKSLKDIEGTY